MEFCTIMHILLPMLLLLLLIFVRHKTALVTPLFSGMKPEQNGISAYIMPLLYKGTWRIENKNK